MRRAILIGLVYPNHKYELKGSLSDLYNFYSYLKGEAWDDLIVLTDIKDDPVKDNYIDSVEKGYIDPGIYTFITEIKQRNQYKLVTKKEDITNALLLSDQCLVYLTGHGYDKGYLIREESILSWETLRKALFSTLTKDSQLMIIIDTCFGWHFNLPFLFEHDGYRLSGGAVFLYGQIVVITTKGKEIASTNGGSITTQALLSCFKSGLREYKKIQEKIDHALTETDILRLMNMRVNIYTNSCLIDRVWSWLWKRKDEYREYTNGIYFLS